MIIATLNPKHRSSIGTCKVTPIYTHTNLIIPPLDGTRVLWKDHFVVFTDGITGITGIISSHKPTRESVPKIYKVHTDGTFAQMFNSLKPEFDNQCCTEHQVLYFCETYPRFVQRNDGTTLFLLKNGNGFSVACVMKTDNGIRMEVHDFDDHTVWSSKSKFYMIIP